MAVSYPDRSMQRMDVLSSFRWSAIFAGLVAALATQLFLSSIGAALGISATAVTENEGAAKGLGIGAGVWMVISPLISMFVGGAVAAWLARPLDRGLALMHGALVWCLSLVVGAFLIGSIASSAFAGILGSAGNAASGIARNVTDPNARQQFQAELQEKRAQAGSQINDPEVRETADKAANVGTGVAWASVLAMLLSFGSALLGASFAHKKTYEPIGRDLRGDRSPVVTTTTPRDEIRPIVTPTGKDIRPGDEYRPDLH
jgi:hypothetical protein